MKNIIILLLLLPISIYSQIKKIYLFDKNQKPINRFEVHIYNKDSMFSIYNEKTNYFILHNLKIDSLKINYNLFYSEKISKKQLKKVDTLFLNEVVALNEIEISKKRKNTLEIGTNGKYRKFAIQYKLENIIKIDISKYQYFFIDYINILIYEKMKLSLAPTGTFISKHNKIELLLFQSNSDNPNNENKINNLLKKPYIIDIGEIKKKKWVHLNLSHLNLGIKKFKHLYIGIKTLDNTTVFGICKSRKNTNIKAYSRGTSAYKWQKLKWHKGTLFGVKLGLTK